MTLSGREVTLHLRKDVASSEPAAGQGENFAVIFTRYLELGSVQALAQDLDRSGIRTKERKLVTGRIIGGEMHRPRLDLCRLGVHAH
jgi:hypothetical protein